MWISISQASLQRICNKEGFDIVGDKRVNLSARKTVKPYSMFVISFESHSVKVRKLLVSLKNKRNFTRCSVE